MKIKSVKVTNFRSILETEFNMQQDLTALVGGNESGKSNVLRALISFFADEPFSPSDKHQLGSGDPEVVIEFVLSSDEKKKIQELTGEVNVSSLTITKKGDVKEIISPKIPQVNIEDESTSVQPVVETNIDSETPVDVEDPAIPEDSQKSDETEDGETIEEVSDTPDNDNSNEPKPSVTPETTEVKVDVNSEILKMLPSLVSVQSVEDLIEGIDVKIKELIEAQDKTVGFLSTINAFLKLGDIDLSQISDPKIPLSIKNKLLLAGGAKAGKKIREYWVQEDLKIHIGTDGVNLAIHIRDGGCLPIRPIIQQNMSSINVDTANKNIEEREDDTKWIWTNFEERSTGFRWFVTFYSKYLSKVAESENIILMIDDLGVFLNASIQKVLYKKLLSMAQNGIQVIYTTHSPYILDFQDSENIRLVEKKEEGTKIFEDWWKRRSFRQLPQPLKDIGFTRSENIFKNKNLLVEGATDITVIKRLTQIFELDTDIKNVLEGINIYPVGGKDEAIGVALYCQADGQKAAILFDSESEALRLNTKAQALGLKSKDVLTLTSPYDTATYKPESIEDLLPDKLIVDGLNTIAQQLLGERWVPMGNVHRKHGTAIEGIMNAIKRRLDKLIEEDVITEDEAKTILSSKVGILAEALANLKEDDYIKERKEAAVNFLKNVSALISTL